MLAGGFSILPFFLFVRLTVLLLTPSFLLPSFLPLLSGSQSQCGGYVMNVNDTALLCLLAMSKCIGKDTESILAITI